jgi:hypothetical protein
MNEPSLATIKRLFAKSGNRCAFPECPLPIVEESDAVTGIVCHIKARSKKGPRYDSKQTDEERHGLSNLILLCGRHSKLIDSEPKKYTAESLGAMKAAHEKRYGSIEITQADARKAEGLLAEYRTIYITAGGHVMLNSPGAIQATNVTIKSARRSVKTLPAEGSLGSDVVRRNYVKHLIDRYNEYASDQPRKGKFSYGAIYTPIKKEFKADWERIPLARFDDLVRFMQARIDKTRLARINLGKGIKNYSTFEEYGVKYAGVASSAGA